jgi:hypothetical protein
MPDMRRMLRMSAIESELSSTACPTTRRTNAVRVRALGLAPNQRIRFGAPLLEYAAGKSWESQKPLDLPKIGDFGAPHHLCTIVVRMKMGLSDGHRGRSP